MAYEDMISQRITRLRFPLIFLILLIHSWNASLRSFPVTDSVQLMVSRELPSGAVPLLFVISGYLFYRQTVPTLSVYRRKMRSRFHTLVVPYLLWNAIALAVQVLGQALPATRGYFTGRTLSLNHFRLYDWFNAFIGFDRTPLNGPLWFLKYLIIMSVLSPVLWHFCRKSRVWGPLTLFVLYLLPWPEWMRHSVFALVFFSLGLYLSQFPIDFGRCEVWLLILYPVLAGARLLGESQNLSWDFDMKLCTLLSMGFWWAVGGRLRSRVFVWLAPAAFFAYVGHGVILQVLRKVTGSLCVPHSEFSATLVYLIPPVAAAAILVGIFRILYRWSPVLLEVLSGGRSGRAQVARSGGTRPPVTGSPSGDPPPACGKREELILSDLSLRAASSTYEPLDDQRVAL
jgi:peptidoglycan/LPS O-acetylase OafA/YrhL